MIYGDIGGWEEESVQAAAFARDLQTIDADSIHLRINSFGGSVKDAQGIYMSLKRHPAKVRATIEGFAVSAASLIAMAADTITMPENALMMIHGPLAIANGAMNSSQHRDMADMLDRFARAMAPPYAAKSGKPLDEIFSMLADGKNHWFTPQEAKDAGFVDEVTSGIEAIASFDLQRFGAVPAAAAAFQRTITMPEKQPAATQPTPQPAPEPAAPLAVVTNGRTQEDIDAIRAMYQPFQSNAEAKAAYTRVLETQSTTVEQARNELLAALGKGMTSINPQTQHIQMGETDGEKFRAAATTALLVRAGQAADERKTIGENPYRAHSLMDLARASLDRAGASYRGMDKMSIVALAITHSTSDFDTLLENTMHKAVQSAYALQPDTWRRFCAVGTVSDFRAHNRYRMASIGNLDTVNENGEFHYKPLSDGEKSSITATTKGNLVNISRQMIVNDDLGAFVGLSAALGRAAARSVEASVYAVLDDNSGQGPTMSDGGILFNTTAITTTGGHANRTAYAAPTIALLDTLRQQMMVQMDVGQNDYLDLRPAVALTRPSLTSTMKILNGSVYDPTITAGNPYGRPNAVAGLVNDIVESPRITWDAVYLFADPNVAPTFEVAFLDGNQTPFLDVQQGFTVDGAVYKVRLDWGVAVIDYRGAVALV